MTCDCEKCTGRLPTLNVDLLDKTLDHVKTLEAFRAEGVQLDERWEQGTWGIQGPQCGTAMCFAGWACRLAGVELFASAHRGRAIVGDDVFDDGRILVVRRDDGSIDSVEDAAVRLLGLTVAEQTLFDGNNTLGDLEDIVDDIKAGSYRHGKGAA